MPGNRLPDGLRHYLETPPKDQVLGAILRVAGLRKELCLS